MKKIIAAILFSCAATQAADELHPVSLFLKAPDSKTVYASGDFNRWSTNATPLKRSSDGTWFVNLRLKAGTYAYKLIKDGQWIFDPAQPAKMLSGQIEVSKLTVPQPFPGFTAAEKTAPAKPVTPWNAADFQKAADKYKTCLATYQKYTQTRGEMTVLKNMIGDLQQCAATFEKYQDSAPSSANCDGALTRCNKLIFDIHAALQLPH